MDLQSCTCRRLAVDKPGIRILAYCCLILVASVGGSENTLAQDAQHANGAGSAQAAANSRQTTSTTVTQAPNREADDKAIYALLFAAHLPQGGKPFIVQKETVHGQRLQALMKSPTMTLPQQNRIVQQALQDARRRGKQAASLPSLVAQGSWRFASERDMGGKPKTDFWKQFYRKFPDARGMAAFALPGYAADGNMALAFMEWHSNAQGGEGLYLLLTREGGKWKIKRFVGGWQE